MSHQALYRMYDESDALLYVGVSMNVEARFAAHRADKPWWPAVVRIELEHFSTRGDVLDAERRAIESESPLYNLRMNPNSSASVDVAPVEVSAAERERQARTDQRLALIDEHVAIGRALREETTQVETELRELILGALADGVPLAKIARLSGYHRNTIRAIRDAA